MTDIKKDQLPALNIVISGGVEQSNLPAFKTSAMQLIESINTELVTDDDFSEAEQASKWLRDGEKRIEQCKQSAIENTASIDEAFKVMDELKESMRRTRLTLDRQIKEEKESRKRDIVMSAEREFSEWKHGATLDVPVPVCSNLDIAGAIKGKKTLSSLNEAAQAEVQRAKDDASALITDIKSKLNLADTLSKGYEFLFAMSSTKVHLVSLPVDELAVFISGKIEEHKEAERQRLEAERQRIRAEEQEALRLEREAVARKEREEAEKRKVQEALTNESEQEEVTPIDPKGSLLSKLDVSKLREYAERYEKTARPVSAPVNSADRQANADTVTVSRSEYDKLVRSDNILGTLQDCGISEWEGLDNAMEEYRKRYE